MPQTEVGVSPSGTQTWWQRPYRTFQTNLREIDAGLDERAVVRQILALGANTWLLNTAGIVSFYPSTLPFQRPSPWLRERASGDLTGDAIREAHAHGVRLIARLDLSKIGREIAEEHPDWCFADAAGRPQVVGGLHSTCPSGPYYQERSLEILGEVLDGYPVDGFFFNWFNFNQRDYAGRSHGICQCVHCRRRFEEQTGLPLPPAEDWDDPAYPRWREYTARTLQELAGRIRRFIGERSPGTALILRQDPDVVFQEVNNAVDRPQPLWVYGAGEFGREIRTAQPAKPAMVNTVLFLDLPYRFQPEQAGLIGLHLTQTISQGVNPCAYVIGTPDRFTGQSLETVTDVFRFHREHERYYAGLRSAARVAIVSSARSEEHFGGDGRERVQKERRGVYRALLEAHVPFDILPDSALRATADEGRLGAYDVLVLPNVAVLDDDQASVLDQYVEAGGGLVASADTATLDGGGHPRSSVGLQSLGAERVLLRQEGAALRSAYLRVTDPRRLPGSTEQTTVAIDRAFSYLDLRPGAEPSLALIPASRYGPPEKCYWEIETEHPGLVRNRFGRGCSALFPWPIGALYHDWSLPEHRSLLAQAVVDAAAGGRQLLTDAPSSVEAVVSRQGTERTLLHLINFSGHRGRSFDDPLPIHDTHLEVACPHPVSSARSLRLDRSLAVTERSGRIAFDLPRLALFDLIVLE